MNIIFRGRHSIWANWRIIPDAPHMMAGALNVKFFHKKCVSKMGRVRSPKRRVRDDNLWSDHGRIVVESSLFILAEVIQGFFV